MWNASGIGGEHESHGARDEDEISRTSEEIQGEKEGTGQTAKEERQKVSLL